MVLAFVRPCREPVKPVNILSPISVQCISAFPSLYTYDFFPFSLLLGFLIEGLYAVSLNAAIRIIFIS
jgi:hypothetical protein